MRQFPHLKRNHRSGNWVYFRRFPKAVRHAQGKTFFERSLRTADRDKLPQLWAEANKEFEAAVATLVQPKQEAYQAPPLPGENRTQHTRSIPSWGGTHADTMSALDLDIEKVRTAINHWGQHQRYERARRLLNNPALISEDDQHFIDECKLVGACGHQRSWLFYCPQLHSLTLEIIEARENQIPEWHGSIYTIQKMVEIEFIAVLMTKRDGDHTTYQTCPATRHRESQAISKLLMGSGTSLWKNS